LQERYEDPLAACFTGELVLIAATGEQHGTKGSGASFSKPTDCNSLPSHHLFFCDFVDRRGGVRRDRSERHTKLSGIEDNFVVLLTVTSSG